MSYRVKLEPMSGNPAARNMGDKSGLWKVVIIDEGSGHIVDENAPRRIHRENISYEEAFRLSGELEYQLNERE